MPQNVRPQSMIRFIDPWAYLALGTVGTVILAGIVSMLFVKSLSSTQIQVSPDETERLEPITVRPTQVGAFRIDVNAKIPRNRWLTYEVQLLDPQGQILAAGIKQAWYEAGEWREEGESGTWQETDLKAGLDVVFKKSEPVTVAIALLEYNTSNNQEIDDPVTFQVSISNSVIDTRHLVGGFWGALVLAIMALLSVSSAGLLVINRTCHDSELNVRALMGGRHSLIKVTIRVIADETAPKSLTCKLFVKDGQQQLLFIPLTMPLSLRRNSEGDVDRAQGTVVCYFAISQRSSYGFYVEVVPDSSVDSTQIVIKERVRTLKAVDVINLEVSS